MKPILAVAAKRNLPAILETMQEPLLVLDHEFRVLDANAAFFRTFQTTARQTLRKRLAELGNNQWDVPPLRVLLEEVLPQRQQIEDFRVEHVFPRIGHKVFRLNARQVFDEGVGTQTILLTFLDITDAETAAGRLRDAREDEALRIAQELHDLSGAELTSIGLELAQLASRIVATAPAEVARQLRVIRRKIKKLSSDTHDLVQRIHPSVIQDLGLHKALQGECDTLRRLRAIRADLHVVGEIDQLPGTIGLPVYRVVQEALFNAGRHSGARRVTVSLELDTRELRLMVRDNGRGFKPSTARTKRGFGLNAMADRVSALGGKLSTESAPGQGTTISATVPISWAALAPVPSAGGGQRNAA